MDAEPVHPANFPEPSIWPFLAAVVTSAFFIASIFTPWAIVYAAGPIAVTLIGWVWPKERPSRDPSTDWTPAPGPAPVMPEVRT